MSMVFSDGSTLMLTKMIEDTVDSIHKFSIRTLSTSASRCMCAQWDNEAVVGPYLCFHHDSLDLVVTMQKTELGRELLSSMR